MKNLLAILFVLLSYSIYSQTVTESIIDLREKYKPLFSKESSILTMDYIRTYTIGKKDTMYAFIVKVNKTDMELTNISVATSVLKSNMFVGISTSYELKNNEEQSIMDREKFKEFFAGAKKIHTFILDKKLYTKKKLNTMVSFKIDNIVLVAEYIPAAKLSIDIKFYIKFGQDTIYEMTKTEYENIMRVVSSINTKWKGIENGKS
jgi:hypothetical protein